MKFGTSSASEVFQSPIQQVLSGIKGCKNISDDIIIYGRTADGHDTALRQVFEVAKQRNLRLKFEKCQFDQTELEFFGYVFSRSGISPSPSKVTAVKESPIPKNASEIRSFLGMLQYCGRFIPNLAKLAAPLRKLTQKGVKWARTETEQTAFESLRQSLTTNSVNGYFDLSLQTEVHVDASPVELGATLSQINPTINETQIIAYASRSLTEVERHYSQIEREALGIFYGIEHFHLYLYGHAFKVINDHKPLETIFANPKC